jgi:NADH-quinone oxidoreductase subunit N
VVRADNFALFVNLILCVIGVLTMMFSDEVVEREQIPPGEYYALTLFGISGMMLMAAAIDLLVIFLALEILSLSVYVPAPKRRSSTSCSARSRAHSFSMASRSPSPSRSPRGWRT